MQTLLEAGPTRMAESVRMVSPGLISLLDTRHRPDLLWDPTEKGNCDGILALNTPSLSRTNSIVKTECSVTINT